ncbi:MAG: TIGR02117 family protein [Bacteroidota bacterium]
MKTAWLFVKRFLLFVVGFIILYVAFSFLLSYIPVGGKAAKGTKGGTLYVHSNGVHLDLILPLELVPDQLRNQLSAAAGTKLLAFGWGDKGFYLDTPTWAELKASTAIKAMFLPSPTAMHVTEYGSINNNWSKVALTQVQWTDLIKYLEAGFKLNEAGRITEIVGKGYTPHDRFYEANGNYSCFKTCNTWVNTGMKRIGVKTAVWTPMDKGVLRYLE